MNVSPWFWNIGGWVFLGASIVVYFMDMFELSLIFSINAIGLMVTSVLWKRLLDKYGNDR